MAGLLDSSRIINETTTLLQKTQRDLNSLVDPDRGIRVRALKKLRCQLVEEKVNKQTLYQFCSEHLHQILLQLFADPVEKCRELAIQLFLDLVEALEQDMYQTLENSFPAISQRFSVLPFPEPSEELRLLLLRLLFLLMKRSEQISQKKTRLGICEVLSRSLLDTFPESKKESCSILELCIQKGATEEARLCGKALAESLLGNLGHQQAKVRKSSLQALGPLILCGNDDITKTMTEIIKRFQGLLFDRTPAVRLQLFRLLFVWLEIDPPHINEFRCRIFALFLSGLSDPSEEVATDVLKLLDECGKVWAAKNVEPFEASKPMVTEDSALETKALVRHHFAQLLPDVLEEIGHWTVQTRERAVLLLKNIIHFAEDAVVGELPLVLSALKAACLDDHPEVLVGVKACGRKLGAVLQDPTPVLDILLPILLGRVSGQSGGTHMFSSLTLLNAFLSGRQKETKQTGSQCNMTISLPLSRIGQALTSSSVLESEEHITLQALAEAVATLLQVVAEQISGELSFTKRLCRALLQALSHPAAEKTTAQRALMELAKLNGFVDGSQLLSVHFPPILASIITGNSDMLENSDGTGCDHCPSWSKNSPGLLVFELFLRQCPAGLATHFALAIPVFESQLEEKKDPELRLLLLALLESVLSSEIAAQGAAVHGTAVIEKMLLPNLVWKAGRAAATIRKVAIACLYSFLRSPAMEAQSAQCLYQLAPRLIPTLRVLLDDYDASSRQLCLLCFQHIFLLLPGSFGDEPVRELYPELLKRLDDSSDTVRKCACGALAAFFKAAIPKYISGTVLEYSTDQLLIHLDDQDSSIQEAVLEVLFVLATIEPNKIKDKAIAAKKNHRNPDFCIQLIDHIA